MLFFRRFGARICATVSCYYLWASGLSLMIADSGFNKYYRSWEIKENFTISCKRWGSVILRGLSDICGMFKGYLGPAASRVGPILWRGHCPDISPSEKLLWPFAIWPQAIRKPLYRSTSAVDVLQFAALSKRLALLFGMFCAQSMWRLLPQSKIQEPPVCNLLKNRTSPTALEQLMGNL